MGHGVELFFWSVMGHRDGDIDVVPVAKRFRPTGQ